MRFVNILTVICCSARIVLDPQRSARPEAPPVGASAVVLPILLLHAMRHLGAHVLAPGAVYYGMPLEFATRAAYGDLLTAVLALIAIAAVTGDHGLLVLLWRCSTSWERST